MDQDQMLKAMIDNLPEKTGKSLDEWKKVLKANPFAKHSEGVKFLKEKHGVTHGYANTIVSLSKEEQNAPEDLVANQYKGKENLKTIYDKLIAVMKQFGADVNVVPKKGTVSLVRKKQFALIKPATKTRIDLGLKMTGKETTDRLENSGPFGTMCTHRVRITEPGEVDRQLIDWLKEAYSKAE
jgi:hypothetical protein